MAKRWPEYDEAIVRPGGHNKLFIFTLTSKAPNDKQVMATGKGNTATSAHANAYIALKRKIDKNK